MRGPGLRIALLIFEAFWLNVVVPGHQRGAVPLPGESCTLCIATTTKCCQKPGPDKPKKGGDPAQHCALCYFAARLCTPPAVDLTPPPLRPVGELPFPEPQAAPSIQTVPTYYGRAPPAAPSHLI